MQNTVEVKVKDNPDLSVVIPCYNEAPHLQQSTMALLQVIEQTRYTYEVMFVDDGSRDNTRELIQELCSRFSTCRYVFHAKNRGRGGAFKTGFAATTGQITGFIDIDLEVAAHYIPPLVNRIEREGYDIATGYRHYLLKQTGGISGIVRHVLSHGYRWVCKFLLGLGIQDSETGYKFFKRETTTEVVLGSEHDEWFWDTEVMSRAALKNLRICEMPVLFIRRADKRSTVRLIPDSLQYVVDLYQFRSKVGLGLTDKSPIYWSAIVYDLVMRLLYSGSYHREQAEVATLIPSEVSVVDVCCGTARLYRDFLQEKHCQYLGLDCNGHFVMAARKRGINVKLFNLLAEEVPAADYVVMCSSFYHFHGRQEEIVSKLLGAARRALIISEPVHNLSSSAVPLLGCVANWLTNPGVGAYDYRFNLEQFRDFTVKSGVSKFIHSPGKRNAIAVFNKEDRWEKRGDEEQL
jgi:glycosyltransferase involved in cell wall biosynthesis